MGVAWADARAGGDAHSFSKTARDSPAVLSCRRIGTERKRFVIPSSPSLGHFSGNVPLPAIFRAHFARLAALVYWELTSDSRPQARGPEDVGTHRRRAGSSSSQWRREQFWRTILPTLSDGSWYRPWARSGTITSRRTRPRRHLPSLAAIWAVCGRPTSSPNGWAGSVGKWQAARPSRDFDGRCLKKRSRQPKLSGPTSGMRPCGSRSADCPSRPRK